jgi:hypothetical protein
MTPLHATALPEASKTGATSVGEPPITRDLARRRLLLRASDRSALRVWSSLNSRTFDGDHGLVGERLEARPPGRERPRVGRKTMMVPIGKAVPRIGRRGMLR